MRTPTEEHRCSKCGKALNPDDCYRIRAGHQYTVIVCGKCFDEEVDKD